MLNNKTKIPDGKLKSANTFNTLNYTNSNNDCPKRNVPHSTTNINKSSHFLYIYINNLKISNV